MPSLPANTRCRHVRIDGTRCSSLALLCHDLCRSHDSQRQTAIIRKRHIPAIAPMMPLVAFQEGEYGQILINLSSVVAACANGNLTRGELRQMSALMRTCTRTLRSMDEVRRLLAQIPCPRP